MSYMDNVEDEVDYGEAEDQTPAGGPAEEDQEEGYEDLYDDVNIGFFEPVPEEASQKDVKDVVRVGAHGGLRFQEDEVSFAHMKGFSVGSAHFAMQQNETRSEMQVKGVALANVKEEGSTVHGDEVRSEGGYTKAAEAGAAIQPQVTITLDIKPKVATSLLPVSINQTSSKVEEVVLPGIHIQASTAAKAKDEAVFPVTAQMAPAPTYPPQDRGSKANGMAPVEPLPGLGLVGHEDYERMGPPVKAGKPLDSDSSRDRVPIEIDNRPYAGDGKISHGGGMKDSITPPAVNDYSAKHNGQSYGGNTMLFVGELHWWTTDVELETALSEFGALKNLKFHEERASGKSKGFCQVEFHDAASAYACKEGMNGRIFHGRPCVVAFANPRTIMQMGNAQVEKAQAQLRAQQAQVQARRTVNDSSGNTRGQSSYQGGDNTRSYGRPPVGTGRGSHGQAMTGRGSVRGRTSMGKGPSGNGGSVGVVAPYGQGLVGPMGSHPSGMMMPQAMMGQGYDTGYGPPRGGSGYGGYVLPGPPFTGMVQPFPTMAPGSLSGVAPHVNPAFFGRNSSANGMGMMGIDGSQNAMWGDGKLNVWVGDEHDKRGREASYDDDGADSDYTYSNELAYEKSRGAEELSRADADWPERRRHRDREGYREQRDRGREGEKDQWDREKAWRSRNKSRSMVEEDEEDDQHMRSREEDYGKRRRVGNER